MANTDLQINPGALVAELSDFSFGLPASDHQPEHEEVSMEPEPPQKRPSRRPGKSTVGDIAVALVILIAAIVGCFGINRQMVAESFPQLAAILHLNQPAEPAKVTSEANAHVKVWADLKTGLYYCPGSESYGRTQNGHYLSQQEALLGRFEPAERKECTVVGTEGESAHR